MQLSVKLEEALDGFIHLGGLMRSEHDRRFVVRLLFNHFHDPGFVGSRELDRSKFDENYPNWTRLIRQLFRRRDLRELTLNNEDFSISVVKETLNWAKRTYFKFESQHAHVVEQELLNQTAQNLPKTDLTQWEDNIEKLQNWYPEQDKNWRFYLQRIQRFYTSLEENEDAFTRQNLAILQQNVLNDWRNSLREKKEYSEKEYLENLAFNYLNDLGDKAKSLLAFGDLISPFYNFMGLVWNETIDEWNRIEWDKLEIYAERLQKDTQLKELAELLGKWQLEERQKKEEKHENTVFEEQWKPNPIGKSEVIGVHHSDELSALLPSEVALLSSPQTELIFSKKFVEKKLLTFQYRSRDMSTETEREEIVLTTSPSDNKGPFILCIDTSGSMFGKPERIAKALALAITEIAIEQNRAVYIISFSSSIETMEMRGKDKRVENLIDFLMMSFHGGTDMRPALEEAMDLLETENYKFADVLVISDFVISSLETELLERLERTRRKEGTHFHSLYVARRPDLEIPPLKIFDHHWIYDLDDPGVIRQTIDHFEQLKGDV